MLEIFLINLSRLDDCASAIEMAIPLFVHKVMRETISCHRLVGVKLHGIVLFGGVGDVQA